MMLPAAEAVFDTTEILESILLNVAAASEPLDYETHKKNLQDLKTFLLAQRVCKRWKLVIERSVKLQ